MQGFDNRIFQPRKTSAARHNCAFHSTLMSLFDYLLQDSTSPEEINDALNPGSDDLSFIRAFNRKNNVNLTCEQLVNIIRDADNDRTNVISLLAPTLRELVINQLDAKNYNIGDDFHGYCDQEVFFYISKIFGTPIQLVTDHALGSKLFDDQIVAQPDPGFPEEFLPNDSKISANLASYGRNLNERIQLLIYFRSAHFESCGFKYIDNDSVPPQKVFPVTDNHRYPNDNRSSPNNDPTIHAWHMKIYNPSYQYVSLFKTLTEQKGNTESAGLDINQIAQAIYTDIGSPSKITVDQIQNDLEKTMEGINLSQESLLSQLNTINWEHVLEDVILCLTIIGIYQAIINYNMEGRYTSDDLELIESAFQKAYEKLSEITDQINKDVTSTQFPCSG